MSTIIEYEPFIHHLSISSDSMMDLVLQKNYGVTGEGLPV